MQTANKTGSQFLAAQPQRSEARPTAIRTSVRLSLSVRHTSDHAVTVEDVEIGVHITQYDRGMFLVSWRQISQSTAWKQKLD